ncbi:unnamed protein product [Linum trigynum]|uniref:Uncharacterized protein n=1 Tax=Linum trigynum TaxID=586398 RepID=A0AAV2EDJ7_9ROSI
MASSTTGAMKALTVDYPSIIARPVTTIPYFKKPNGISLFYTLFSRFSDTFVFLVIALLSYTGFVTAALLTQSAPARTDGVFLLGVFTGVGYPFLFLYFNKIHQWRKTNLAKRLFFNPPGVLSNSFGSLIFMSLNCVKIWAGVYNSAYALIALLGVLVIVSMYLALRPTYGYRIIDGLLAAVALYGFVARRNDDVTHGDDGSMVNPCLIAFASCLITMFYYYFEAKAKEAENPNGVAK